MMEAKKPKLKEQDIKGLREEVEDLYLEDKRMAERRELRLTENLAFFRGYQWGVPLRDGLFDEYADIDPRVEAETDNFIVGAVRTNVARAFTSPLNFSVISAREDAVGKARARNSELLLRSLLRTGAISFIELLEARTAAAIMGAAWMKVCWDPFKGRPDPSRSPAFQGDVDWQYVSILDAFPENTASRPSEMRRITHRKFMPANQAEQWWPMDVLGEPTEGRFSPRGSRGRAEMAINIELGTNTHGYATGDETIEVVEYWEKPSVRFPQGRFVIFSGSLTLYAGPLPYRFPWVLIQGPNKAPGTLYADGMVHHLKSLQRSINLASSKAREAVNIALNPPMLVHQDANIPDERFDNVIGTIINWAGLKEPTWMQPPNIMGILEGYQASRQKVFGDISTHSDVAGGAAPAPGTSARAIAYMAELSQRIHVPDDIVLELSIIEGLTLTLDLVRQWYDEGRLLKIIGAQNRIIGQAFRRQDYDFDVELVIDAFSPRNLSPAVKRAEVSEYFAQGLFDDQKPGAITARRLMEVNSEEGSTLDVLQAHRRRAESEDVAFDLWARGEQPSVPPLILPQDNDDIHLEQHELTAVTNWLNWPPEIQQMFMEHLSQHEMQRAQKMGVYAQEAQQLQPPGKGAAGASMPSPPGSESPLDGGHSAPLPETVTQEPSVMDGGEGIAQ